MHHLIAILLCFVCVSSASASDWLQQAAQELQRTEVREGHKVSVHRLQAYLEDHNLHMSQTFYKALESFYEAASIGITARTINDIKAKNPHAELWGGEELLEEAVGAFQTVVGEIDSLTIGEQEKQRLLALVLLASPSAWRESLQEKFAPILMTILQDRDDRFWSDHREVIFAEKGTRRFHWSSLVPPAVLMASLLVGIDVIEQMAVPYWAAVNDHVSSILKGMTQLIRTQKAIAREMDYQALRAELESDVQNTPYFLAPVVERVGCSLVL